jgi:hypothetical protein
MRAARHTTCSRMSQLPARAESSWGADGPADPARGCANHVRVWESVHHAYSPKGPHAAYASMQHTRAPGSVGSTSGHLPKPMYPRECIADGAAMRENTWQTTAYNCSDAPNGCGRWRARAPGYCIRPLVLRQHLSNSCVHAGRRAASWQLPARSQQLTTRRVRVTRFSIVHAYPESGYV